MELPKMSKYLGREEPQVQSSHVEDQQSIVEQRDQLILVKKDFPILPIISLFTHPYSKFWVLFEMFRYRCQYDN